MQIKASSRTDEERRNAMYHKKPKNDVGRGRHLKRFGDEQEELILGHNKAS